MTSFATERPALFTTHDVLSETVTLVGVRQRPSQAVRFGRSLLDSRVIQIVRPDEPTERAAIALYEKFDSPDFSYTDCVSFALMRALGITKAFTFDEDFQKAGFECIPAGGIRKARRSRNPKS